LSDNAVRIGADSVDTDEIIAEAEAAVDRKCKDGVYMTAGLDCDKRINPLEFKNDDEFLAFYLDNLRETAFVDISDFDIEEKRTRFRAFFIRLKRGIWSLMKFYTYRLWSQQNQINGLLLSGIEGIHERHREEISRLEKRISELESAAGK
jgi:hypothetical protein